MNLLSSCEPAEIRAGDSVRWSRVSDVLTPGDVLSYMLVGRVVGYPVAGDMVTPGEGGFEIAIPSEVTAVWQPGDYRWQAYLTDAAGQRSTVGEGVLRILPNLQSATGGLDDREEDEILLDNVIAMLQNKATTDAQEYTTGGRMLKHYTWDELMRMRSTLEKRVRAIRIRRGEILPKQTIGVSFRNGY